MKKIVLLLCAAVLLISCQQEQINEDITSDLTSSIDIDTEKYFGVFVSNDIELHGEIRVHKANSSHYKATVKLVNSDILYFRGAINNLSTDVKFTGERGSFTINFSEENITTSQFLVDGKEGMVKAYPDTKAGGSIAFGTYAQDGVPGFVGTWDMITFGTPEGHPGLFLIEDIVIFHKDTHLLFDTTAGDLEPFFDACFSGTPFIGGATDGFTIVAFDQIATIAGFEGVWHIVSGGPGLSVDPFTCVPLPPGIDGFWDWGSKAGTLTRVFI